MPDHAVVSETEWLEARKALLVKEKALTRARDALNAERLALPWVKVDKSYVFDTPTGPRRLGELFNGRSQLIVYHFMFGPDWEAGCPGCSFLADHLDGTSPHLNHHDVTLTAVSRAPLAKIEAYKARMGWRFPWVSSAPSDFNFDYGVSFSPEDLASGSVTFNFREMPVTPDDISELPGLSAFYCDEAGRVYRTYSCYARGAEDLLSALMILDRAPLGRNEKRGAMDFVRRHDEYGPAPHKACCGDANA